MYLFIDTTERITLGLIDKNYFWVEFVSEDIKSISSQIHKYIFDLLSRNNIDIDSLDALIYCAGPGSYTGMRISEGLSSILNWQGLPSYTFYHFEIPKLCGIEAGAWTSKAFKKEIFQYSWSGDSDKKELIKEEDYTIQDNLNFFDKSDTDDLLRNSSEKIFKQIISRKTYDEIFYYRSLEEEFSKQ